MHRLLPLLLFAATTLNAAVTVHPMPPELSRSDRFRLWIDGQPVPVLCAEVAAEQEFKSWPHPMEHRPVGFASFDMDGPVEVKVEVLGQSPKSARIRPLSKAVPALLSGKTVTFQLARPDNLVLELNEDVYDHLYLFANPPETRRPNPKDPDVLFFGPGVHETGRLRIERDNQTVYLAGGAVVKGCIHAEGRSNLTIAGRGILLGTGLSRGANLIRPADCTGVRIEDLILIDSPSWTVRMERCRQVVIRNLRQISYLQNTDGIDPCNCEDVEIDGVFIRSYDDGVVVKALKGELPSRNIRTFRSTFLTDHGTSLKAGNNETLGPPIQDLLFQDCDVLSCRGTPLGLFFNGPSRLSNIRFENIRVEEPRLNPMSKEGGIRFIRCAISKGNAYLSNYVPGTLRDVVFKDVVCLPRTGLPLPGISLAGHSEASSVADVLFDRVRFGDNPVAGPGHPAVTLGEFVYNVRFRATAGGETVTAAARSTPLPEPVQPVLPPMPPAEPEITGAGEILIEAETGELGKEMRLWCDEPGASAGWYLTPAPYSNYQSKPPGAEGQASYVFHLPFAGTHRIDALVMAPASADNSFWVRVDDGDWVEWTSIPVSPDWDWSTVREGSKKTPATFTLRAGDHTLTFGAREDGTRLDRIRISPVNNPAP